MLSLSNTQRDEETRQERIRQQIAELQAQLPKDTAVDPPLPPVSPKRRKRDDSVLAPATPSPSESKTYHVLRETNLSLLEKRKVAHVKPSVAQNSAASRASSSNSSNLKNKAQAKKEHLPLARAAPSALVAKLASLSKTATAGPDIPRSSGFTETAKPPPPFVDDDVQAPLRDERLALIEDVPLGPVDYTPQSDDPDFERLEPNSGIRLSCVFHQIIALYNVTNLSSYSEREMPHEDLQDHLRGRYILSPSRLYATARLAPDKQSYEIPLAGDFVTIAVVAERGPIRYSRAPVAVTRDDDGGGGGSDDEYADASKGGSKVWQVPIPKKDGDKKGKAKDEGASTKKPGKKFVNLKLVDFGARASSSASGGRSVIRGDAQLALLLFESDACETREDENGKNVKVYRGGSRGAFENMSKLREGAVVALLNPRVLKPFQVRLRHDPEESIFMMPICSAPTMSLIRKPISLPSPPNPSTPSSSLGTLATSECAPRSKKTASRAARGATSASRTFVTTTCSAPCRVRVRAAPSSRAGPAAWCPAHRAVRPSLTRPKSGV